MLFVKTYSLWFNTNYPIQIYSEGDRIKILQYKDYRKGKIFRKWL